MTADHKDYLFNRDKLTEPIQTQLSRKEENFSQFVFAFLKSIRNFKHFTKSDDAHGWCISQITGSKQRVYCNV